MLKQSALLLFVVILTWGNTSQADTIGQYEIADYSNFHRDISLGATVTESSITQQGGMNMVNLSGDNGFIKTDSGLEGFTYQSDWSWMAILKKEPAVNCRIFMRGMAWVDKTGDFDLRMNEESMYTWHRQGGWVDFAATDPEIAGSGLIWLASTYDVSEGKNRLYVNGQLIGEDDIGSMDDLNNTNPVNINGQWAGGYHGVGNIYGEGEFGLVQLILSQSRYSQSSLQQAYATGDYMARDDNTWLDIQVVPEPATLSLLGVAGLAAMLHRRRR